MAKRECCKKNPFTRDPVSRELYCKDCFGKIIENRVRKAIRQYKLIKSDDHVAIGYSGGKDSTVLLYLLHYFKQRFPNNKLTAITIDEGITGYRDSCIEITKKVTTDLQINHEILSFEDIYGISLDELVLRSSKITHHKSPCAICGILRRRALNYSARKIKATKLATGHNLDDEAQSIIMNMVRGDYIRFQRLSRIPKQKFEKLIPRIRPLVHVTEPEIVKYAYIKNLKYHSVPCPYAPTAMRNEIRDFLMKSEQNHPGTLKNIVNVHNKLKLKDQTLTDGVPKYQCKSCNELTNHKICPVCSLLEEMEIEPPYQQW